MSIEGQYKIFLIHLNYHKATELSETTETLPKEELSLLLRRKLLDEDSLSMLTICTQSI